jgi:hypothetical protein
MHSNFIGLSSIYELYLAHALCLAGRCCVYKSVKKIVKECTFGIFGERICRTD